MRVLQIVSDDVGLLEEQAHGVGQLGVLAHLRVFQLGCREELRQAHAHQPCHVVTILQRGEHTDHMTRMMVKASKLQNDTVLGLFKVALICKILATVLT